MDAAAGVALGSLAVSLGTAIVGWNQVHRAERQAAEANATARHALDLAEAAEARAQRLENAKFERGDVRWESDWSKDDHTLTVRNVGLDVAHDVELVVDPKYDMAGPRRHVNAETVEPAGSLGINLADEVAAGTSPEARARLGGYDVVLAIDVRVTWRSEAGTPGAQTWDSLVLDTFYSS